MVVDGPCAGAAANLAVAADFTIASEKAKFIQAFVGVGLALMLVDFTSDTFNWYQSCYSNYDDWRTCVC